MAFDQAPRSLNFQSPLGENAMVLTHFRGDEELSRLFRFELSLLSDDNDISAKDIVGKNVTFSARYANGERRYFNGMVQRFTAGDENVKGVRSYHSVVVPWLWFLTQTADCRIFQEKTVVQIIEQIFQDLGFSDFEKNLSGDHPVREYCVQYRETDFTFVSRLMEEEGIYYYFKHENGKHVLVMSDSPGGYIDAQENSVEYPYSELAGQVIRPHILSWEHVYEFRTGKYAHTDYNFKTPKSKLMVTENTLMSYQDVKKYEWYDYPGEYPDKGVGTPLARIRMEEFELENDTATGTSSCQSFSPGYRFSISKHRSKSEEGKSFVIKRLTHEAHEGSYETGDAGGTYEYRNEFVCFPASTNFRPARSTPRPIVRGPQTAVVVGPSGAEIFTDEFSRVKVQFFWDREGGKDDKSSCWIRVSQNWAGQNWGFVCIPRIGQEVIVGFLEGDPDQPIIIGRVYNADQMPPYDLPGNMTQSGIKSRSSKGGNAENFNEIRFEDKKGQEQLFIHAEKNQDIEVENDETHWVGHDRTKTIDHDETTFVKHDRTETVDNNETITIHGARTEQVDKDESITIGGNRTENVDKDESITIGAGRVEQVAKDERVSIQGARTHNVSKDDSLSVGKNLTITAGDSISLTTGKASIVLKKDGTITISGKDITITGKGKITGKASEDMILKGKKILQN